MERRRIGSCKSEEGIALLISIFILLLISVVAIALIVSSGTESALAGNYRSSTGVYYAAMAGLEEVRARLRPQSPISFKNTDPAFLPAGGAPVAPCSPIYVINSLGGENVTPWDAANPYYDAQFNQEFAGICGLPNPSPSTPSIWNRNPLNGLPFPGPLYKWVRINGVSEKSLNLDVGPAYDGIKDLTPVYYDGTQLNDQTTGSQVLEITSLAVLPNGSQKMVQYLAAAVPARLPPLSAALTLAGSQTVSRVAYTAPSNNAGFFVDGSDHDCNGNAVAGTLLPAIGVFNNADKAAVIGGGNGGNGIPAAYRPSNYPGLSGSPDVEIVNGAFPTNLQTPSALDSIVQSIIQDADVIVPSGPVTYPLPIVTGSALTSLGMSSTNPMTVVVNGNLDLTGWHNTGYGLLLVTGNLIYDPDASWNGIVLVIGQGTVTGSRGGSGEFLGAFLVASTRDPSGNLRPDPTLGPPSIDFNHGGSSMGGNGIYYSSCWIQKAQPASGYKILSFHEISQ
jgi:hypothetical protein